VEDNIQNEYNVSEFLTKKSTTQERTLKSLNIVTSGKTRVELVKINQDGFLRFGDQIQIQNLKNQGGIKQCCL
jgi:hypothetical protein